jgi:hypothetical protein
MQLARALENPVAAPPGPPIVRAKANALRLAGDAVTANAGALSTPPNRAISPTSVLLAVGALAGRRLAARERIDRRDAALLEVLVGLWLLLFLVAAHLTLGHGDLSRRPVEKIRRDARIANPPAFVCSGEDCKTIDRKISARALLFCPMAAALNGGRAFLRHPGANRRWNRIVTLRLTNRVRRADRVGSTKPFEEDLP